MIYNDHLIIKQLLAEPRSIILSAHSNPDGDTIGSCLALYHLFIQLGHNTCIISPNPIPVYLNWLAELDKIIVYDIDNEIAEQKFKDTNLIFSVDYNAYKRSGDGLSKLIEQTNVPRILIDHHPNPDLVFDALISDTSASSTAELVFQLINDLGHASKINKDIAECLYVGLLTDTGSFSFSINTDKPYKMAAFLFNKGIDVHRINQKIYGSFNENRLRLTGFAISQKLYVYPELRFAIISLTKKELEEYKHQTGDTEGLVNYALGIENIVAAALLTEREDKIRISLRSKGDFAVNAIASDFFAGGGHKNAAGGDSFIPMNETIESLVKIISQFKIELNEIEL
ncbi:MAG: bifunctional oligoribonuclease/PAP phosphatase NrnA [Bacteroidota bacterium]